MQLFPKISIIIPTYNASKTLSVALESILEQTYTDYEILIVDGLSTDHTVELAKSYQDERIKIISEKDSGIYDAMNKGIRLAEGEWLYFLGGDDRLFDNKVLENIQQSILKCICDVVYGDVFSTRFNGRYNGEFEFKELLTKNICHQSIFFKKSVFEKTGLFDLKYKGHADWDHNFKWFFNPLIQQKYLDLVVAEYADGGFSSMNNDERFEKDKILNFLKYGKKQLPIKLRLLLLLKEIKRNIRYWDIPMLIKIVLRTPKIIIGA